VKRLLAGLAVAALIGYLLTGLAQIRPDERAVVKRFGRIIAYPGPGLWVGLPWGIDRIERVPVRTVRQVKVGYIPEAETPPNSPIVGQYLTGDSNLVNVELTVNYDVRDEDTELERFVTEQTRVESLIVRATETVLAQWIAAHSVDDVLLTGNARLPGAILPRVQRLLQPYPHRRAHRSGQRVVPGPARRCPARLRPGQPGASPHPHPTRASPHRGSPPPGQR
jgi:membrane protease subunit HflK